MGKLVTLSNENHAQLILNGLWDHFQHDLGTDFHVIVGRDREQLLFKCHGIILAIICPQLKSLKNKSAIFETVSESSMDYLMEFVYRGKISICQSKLAELKVSANTLGLGILTEVIDKYLDNNKRKKNNDDYSNDMINLPAKRTRKPTAFTMNQTEVSEKSKKSVKRKATRRTKQSPSKTNLTRQRRPTCKKTRKLPPRMNDQTRHDTNNAANFTTSATRGHKGSKLLDNKLGKAASKENLDENGKVNPASPTLTNETRRENTNTVDKSTSRKGGLKHEELLSDILDEGNVEQDESETQPAFDDQTPHENYDIVSCPTPRKRGRKRKILQDDNLGILNISEVEKQDEYDLTGVPKTEQTQQAENISETTAETSNEIQSYLQAEIIELAKSKKANKEWTCKVCDITVVGFYRQIWHLQCHEKPELKLKCHQCDFQCEISDDLTKHVIKYHSLQTSNYDEMLEPSF
ncbi:hypothetical protein CHUAL_012713 [Chamberlinius hualienensis]